MKLDPLDFYKNCTKVVSLLKDTNCPVCGESITNKFILYQMVYVATNGSVLTSDSKVIPSTLKKAKLGVALVCSDCFTYALDFIITKSIGKSKFANPHRGMTTMMSMLQTRIYNKVKIESELVKRQNATGGFIFVGERGLRTYLQRCSDGYDHAITAIDEWKEQGIIKDSRHLNDDSIHPSIKKLKNSYIKYKINWGTNSIQATSDVIEVTPVDISTLSC